MWRENEVGPRNGERSVDLRLHLSPFLGKYKEKKWENQEVNREKPLALKMGCSFSGLNALYDAVNGGGDVWINDNRFRIIRQIGEGGFAFVYLVKDVNATSSNGSSSGLAAKIKSKHPSCVSGSDFTVYRHLNLVLFRLNFFNFCFPFLDRWWHLRCEEGADTD